MKTPISALKWLKLGLTLAFMVATICLNSAPVAASDQPINIGRRRELFVDEVLIDLLQGEVRQQLHHPTPGEVVLVCDRPWEGTAVTEGLFMASRDGGNFKVFEEAFIRPGLRTEDSWFYGDNYQSWGLVETRSHVALDAPNELSIYVTEATLQNGKPARLRRYTLRLDGFVSINATMKGGKLLTKPIRFSGKKLTLNYSSSARGGIRVGIDGPAGESTPGYTLDDCPWIYGDSLAREVEWTRSGAVTSDVSKLAGKSVRLIFELKDADLYSFQFE